MHSNGQYAAPTENESSAFIPNSTGQYNESISTYRHIQLRDMNDKNFSINEMNPMYDPLHYPLMFPYGDLGYEYIPHNQYYTKKPLTPQLYCQQILQIRPHNPLHFLVV